MRQIRTIVGGRVSLKVLSLAVFYRELGQILVRRISNEKKVEIVGLTFLEIIDDTSV